MKQTSDSLSPVRLPQTKNSLTTKKSTTTAMSPKQFMNFLSLSRENNKGNGLCSDKVMNAALAGVYSPEQSKTTKKLVYRSDRAYQRATGKSKVMINFAKAYFRQWGTYESMPSKVEDVLVGCCRHSDSLADNTHLSSRLLFSLMINVDTIATRAVMDFMNGKRNQTEQSIDERYARYLCAAMRRLCNVFQHHLLLRCDVRVSNGSRLNLWDEGWYAGEIEDCILAADPYADDSYYQEGGDKVSRDFRRNNAGSGGKTTEKVNTMAGGQHDVAWLPIHQCYVDVVTGEVIAWCECFK